jgi:anthranilate phosphoribosyltransferase
VAEVRGDEVITYEITPEMIGVRTHAADAVTGGDARTNADIARAVLNGGNGARHDVVVANAGAALYVAGITSSIHEGVLAAKESIASGRANGKLQQLIAETSVAGGVA